MLQKIHIRNYAIIDELDMEFDERLNVITGETGAGKSIILGALSLILGDRADTSVLIDQERKCVVEAHFLTDQNGPFNRSLEEAGLDVEAVTIVRREIASNGKSRAFINDTPVTLSALQELTAQLVDLHKQADNRQLEKNGFLYQVVDAVAESRSMAEDFKAEFDSYKKTLFHYQKQQEKQTQWRQEADYKTFLWEEMEAAQFHEEEIEQAEQQLKQLSHAEQIKSILTAVSNQLEEGEQPINQELKKLYQQLASIGEFHPTAAELGKRMESAFLELKDVAEEAHRSQLDLDLDPDMLSSLEERVSLGYKLFKKHQINSTHDLLRLKETLEQEIRQRDDASSELIAMEQELALSLGRLKALGLALHEKRAHIVPALSQKISDMLALVGMPNARFQIEVAHKEELNEFGSDDIAFLIDTNKSGKFGMVQKVASGGESSRIMLCIKALTAQALALPTLIFDEVDTGISGEAAIQVGLLLRSLSNYHQVLCITHQPQVAGKGSKHFYVYKAMGPNGRLSSHIRPLGEEERVLSIAKMIGGEDPSPAALANARELVK